MSNAPQLAGTLRDARHRSRLNLGDLGTLLGVHPGTILQWELGAGKPTGLEFLKLCVVHGEDLGYFLGEHPSTRVAGVDGVAA